MANTKKKSRRRLIKRIRADWKQKSSRTRTLNGTNCGRNEAFSDYKQWTEFQMNILRKIVRRSTSVSHRSRPRTIPLVVSRLCLYNSPATPDNARARDITWRKLAVYRLAVRCFPVSATPVRLAVGMPLRVHYFARRVRRKEDPTRCTRVHGVRVAVST